MPEVQSITTAEVPQSDHVALRMKRYAISMGIRMAGLVGAFLTEGWVRWVCVALAVVLPYVAVALGSESMAKPKAPTPYTEQPEALPAGTSPTATITSGPAHESHDDG